MLKTRVLSVSLFVIALAGGYAAMALHAADEKSHTGKPAETKMRYFEMRTYHAAPGKLEALNARFRDYTVKLFKKHGMESIGYWTPADEASGKNDTLVYVLAYPSKEAAEASWKAFRADPDWIKAKGDSEVDGPLVAKVDSLYLNPTDYSAIK